jgi:hypothetical protein
VHEAGMLEQLCCAPKWSYTGSFLITTTQKPSTYMLILIIRWGEQPAISVAFLTKILNCKHNSAVSQIKSLPQSGTLVTCITVHHTLRDDVMTAQKKVPAIVWQEQWCDQGWHWIPAINQHRWISPSMRKVHKEIHICIWPKAYTWIICIII